MAASPELVPKVLQRPPRPPTHRGLALAPTAGCMITLEPFSEDQGRSAVHPSGGSHQSASLHLMGLLARCLAQWQTPWSVFHDGSNGEPTGQRPERSDIEAFQRSVLPTTIEEMALHECIERRALAAPYPC
ncbi:hypothetical protein CQW23_32491 [Capsicum baccatum]|uniref:Uncharacterized protein n=1 Tax=Capsicum baccatum TaxID=33114 RepID=A0A2G2V4N6_CAPBA|nr:hypothetical protein CQW23_32491 [Capsicum baccatum]